MTFKEYTGKRVVDTFARFNSAIDTYRSRIHIEAPTFTGERVVDTFARINRAIDN